MKPVLGTPEELLLLDLPERVRLGLTFLRTVRVGGDYSAPGKGAVREEIRGGEVFALFQTVETKPLTDTSFEAHEKYWDIQYLTEGEEAIRTADFTGQPVAEAYDPARDIAFYKLGEGADWQLSPGKALAIPPGVLHAPCVAPGLPGLVRKVVVKCLKREPRP